MELDLISLKGSVGSSSRFWGVFGFSMTLGNSLLWQCQTRLFLYLSKRLSAQLHIATSALVTLGISAGASPFKSCSALQAKASQAEPECASLGSLSLHSGQHRGARVAYGLKIQLSLYFALYIRTLPSSLRFLRPSLVPPVKELPNAWKLCLLHDSRPVSVQAPILKLSISSFYLLCLVFGPTFPGSLACHLGGLGSSAVSQSLLYKSCSIS